MSENNVYTIIYVLALEIWLKLNSNYEMFRYFILSFIDYKFYIVWSTLQQRRAFTKVV